jgi:hypothetical protein
MRKVVSSDAALQRPKYAGVAFAEAKGMTSCFGPAARFVICLPEN